MTNLSPIAYNVAIEGDFPAVLVDWGNDPQWARRYADQLQEARRLSLIPKAGEGLPVVTVQLDGGKRWVLFSRVVARVGGPSIRLYAIGWQQTIGGVNTKSITWVYPNGTIESGENPAYAEMMLEQAQFNA